MLFFSIVLPLYNKQQHITQALDSILNQSYDNYEVIIINDGSTDGSQTVVSEWISSLSNEIQSKFTLHDQINCGVSCARNNGVKKAKYEYIAFLDCDDFWKPEHLKELSSLINDFSNVVDIFSNYCIQQQDNQYIFPKLGRYANFTGVIDYFKVSMISNGFLNSSSVCVKKQALIKNPFPEKMKNFEDMITWARIANKKGLAFSSKSTAVYVIKNAQASAHVNFENYLRYEQLLQTIDYNRFFLKIYSFKFFLIHILYARMNMNLNSYIKASMNIFRKSFIISLCLIIGLFFPKFILNILKDLRKNKS